MNAFTVNVYSHHFVVSNFNRQGRDALIRYAMEFAEYELVKRWTGESENVLKRFYAASTRSRDEFRFHIHALEGFYEYMERVGYPVSDMEVKHHQMFDPVPVELEMIDSFVLRDYQVPITNYIIEPGKTKLATLQAGQGKTSLTLAALCEIGFRTAIVIRGMFVDRWIQDLTGPKSIVKTKKSDIMVVRGSKDLRNLIALAKAGELHAKIIIITNKTLYNFFEHYEMFPHDVAHYGCTPVDLYQTLGVGVRVIDEVHLDFHLNFRQDLYTHVHKTISLSATLEANNPTIERMYRVVFPNNIRIDNGAVKRYTAVKAIMYRLHDPYKAQYTQRGRDSYNHIAYEEWIMGSKQLTNNYLDMIETCVWKYFTGLDDYVKGQRMIIFAGSIEMCERITGYLRKRYPEWEVNKYTAEDEYETLLKSDICVSTLLSAGTAVDIPGLRVVLMTTAIGSTPANLQALGRLRELHTYPGVIPHFLYLTCTDLKPHNTYHDLKLEKFNGRVLSHQIVEMGMKL